MNSPSFNYSNNSNNISDTYTKLKTLCDDVKRSWHQDRDETNSMKEIIEIIDGMLVMTSLEEYFSNNKSDLEYFLGDFSKEVITFILIQPVIYGENGDEIALDLLFHYVKLYMHFHKNKEYSQLFGHIRKIFSREGNSSFFVTQGSYYKTEINPKKGNTFEQFNQEYCKDFKKEKIEILKFNVGDKVDVLIQHNSRLGNTVWVRGLIIEIEENQYVVEIPSRSKYNNKVNIPFENGNILKEGTKTTDWDWRLSLKENDVVDCYDRGRWYPSTICKVVNESKNENGIIYKEYKVGFRLYPESFVDNSNYDYNIFIESTIFWDNNDNVDSEGKSFYGDGEGMDEELPFFEKRFQKFQTYSSIQRENLSNQMNKLLNSYNNSPHLGNNNNIITVSNQNSDCEDRLKMMTKLLEEDKIESNIDDFYYYEKDNKINYIIGKNDDSFSFYFAKLLKLMADNGYFEEMMKILNDKPTSDEIYNIFYILMYCTSYIHKEFYKKNMKFFKETFFNMMDNLSSKEIRSLQKEVTELANNFFYKLNYILSTNKKMKKEDLEDINLNLSLKMIKSSIFDKKIQGIKKICDFIKSISDEEGKKYIIDLIKKYDIIKDIFGTNYHTQIISKSNEILELMIKNNELSEEELKLIWSLTKQGDLEAKMTIIKLLTDINAYFNEKYSNILLDCIREEDEKKIDENKIDLIYDLAIKTNNENFLMKCCELYCNKALEMKDINILSKSLFVSKILNLISKGEKICQIIFGICENNLKSNSNSLTIFFLLEKIIEKYKNHIIINSDNNDNNLININEDFINKEIHKLIDNDKLLNLFKEDFLLYKKKAKESLKEEKGKMKNIKIDFYTHEENMKNRINFLIKTIQVLYPNFEILEPLKEICFHEPVFQSDKLFFYDCMKKFISEKNFDKYSKEKKIAIETQLFNMLKEENKTEMTLSQYNLYIEIFLDINRTKEILTFSKNPNDEYLIIINDNKNIEDIFGIEKLWDLLFQLNKEEIIQKIIKFIYDLYQNKKEIQKLLDKCVNIIKDVDNINYNKLEKCIKVLKFIILDSEKKGYVQIKPHFYLLKDCIISIPLELKKVKRNNPNNMQTVLNLSRSMNTMKYFHVDLLFGNTTFMELKQIIAENNNIEEKKISVNFITKENNNSQKNNILDSSYNNKSLKEILNINIDSCENFENQKKDISPNKFVFTGDKVENEPFIHFGQINQKFKQMITEWFHFFSNGNEIMEKEQLIKYISCITNKQDVDDKSQDYIDFIDNFDKREFILEEEFVNYYCNLCQRNPEIIKEQMKNMKYRDDFQKKEVLKIDYIDNKRLPRYILGNDKEFFDALNKIFMKFEKKIPIYEFVFFLSTNESEYNQLLENFQNLFNEENNNKINYLEQLYKLIIIDSFIQDLEISQIVLKETFKSPTKRKDLQDKIFKIMAKEYIPFDGEKNLNKKKLFLVNFIENKGYERLIKYIENLLDYISNDNNDEEQIKYKCCIIGLKIINTIYNSFIEKNISKENQNKVDIYYLNNILNIGKILNEQNKNENEFNKLKELVLNTTYLNLIEKIISFLLKSQYSYNNKLLCYYCFNLFIILITNNELLSKEIKKSDKIIKNITDLIKSNINSPSNIDKFFIQSLTKYINNLSNNKITPNKLDFEFLSFIFDISNSLFKELANNNDDKKKGNITNSITLFFDFFSNLIKIILTNENNINQKSNDFIFQIYELLFKDLKEENKEKKISEETFLGFIKILMTSIKSDQLIKKQIISKKINDETLFDIIYNKIINEANKNENYQQINKDDLDLESIVMTLKEEKTDSKFIQMKTCNEFMSNFNSIYRNKDELTMSQNLYDIFNDFIVICLSGLTEPEYISKLMKIIEFKKNINYFKKNSSNKVKIPKSYNHVGLKNIGSICYMNSILQQMYMVPSFRYAIMSSDDKKIHNFQSSFFFHNTFDDNLLHQLQKMYTFLTYSEKQAYNPKDFCASFKDFDNAPINPMVQQDSQEFFNNFCDKIENCLKNTKYKYIIDNIFTGKTCSTVICEECKTVSNRFEDFYNLTLEVKNMNSLYESLHKLIEPEKIEQFKCEVCKKNVKITKRTSLAKLPNVLFVHLKRFYMDYETGTTGKINSKFEFPNILDLKKFCAEEINKKENEASYETGEIYPKEDEYYQYELKGINVHIGNAQGGHYISFVDVERDGHNNDLDIKSSIEKDIIKSKWLKFNDSIVTEFDTKEIPVESYGGYVNNNENNENIQNAYLLIYERKKKTPIKIVIEDKENININNESNNEKCKKISFDKEQKKIIDKFYDISYSNKENRVKEEELYDIIFTNEENKENYYYVPYYNIEKTVLKDNIIEVMNKNRKFFSNKIKLQEKLKYKDEFNDILFSNIHLKDFNILDNEFSINDKKELILFFKEQIFDNKIFRNHNLSDEEEEKVIINDRTNILLEKLIMPILAKENNDYEDYDDLVQYIGNIFLSTNNLEKIFETRDMSRVFDIKNIKLMSEIIYSILNNFNKYKDIKLYFRNIFKLIDEIIEVQNCYINNNNENNDNKENENKSPLFYLYDLVYKILHLNYNLVEMLISSQNDQNIAVLISRINKIKTMEIRKIIYDILNYLIDNCYDYTRIKKGNNSLNKEVIIKLQGKAMNQEKKFIRRLFKEKIDLLVKFINIIQYNDKNYSMKFNQSIARYLFGFGLREKKLTIIMDLMFEIINIKDNFILDRLYLLMGYPEMILKQQIKEEKNEDENENENEESDKDSDDDEQIKTIKIKRKKVKDEKGKENNEEKHFWPLFGNKLLENSENGEIFKYTNNIKLHESHCILAQLFPCSNIELYNNVKFIEKDEKLSENERINYIYKLISIALLNEGNYALFKYIYLTPSRFISKYSNLYEEIIDILSKDNKYDLTEITKNAEICIKRINFEIKRIYNSMSMISNKKLEESDEEENVNNKEKIENANNIDENENPPDLPEKMMKQFKNNNDIEEFTGFIPKQLPDSIQKVVYSFVAEKKENIIICVKYYTSFKNNFSFKKKEIENSINKESINNSNEENKIIENEQKENISNENENDNIVIKGSESDSDNEFLNPNLNKEDNVFNVNKLRISEKMFLGKIFNIIQKKKKVIIYDNLFDNKKKAKLSFVRFIQTTSENYRILFKVKIDLVNSLDIIKNNYYLPNLIIGSIKSNNYTDICSIYRKFKSLDFIKEKYFTFKINYEYDRNNDSDSYCIEWSDSD